MTGTTTSEASREGHQYETPSTAAPYGKKGGVGATRGRKAETIEAEFAPGITGRKRVFFGQRWMTYLQSDDGKKPIVQAWADEVTAREYIRTSDNNFWVVQLFAEGKVIAKAETR